MSKKKEQQINKDFSYASQIDQADEVVRQNCIDLYKKHIGTACKLEHKHSLFLDANVLLAYYQLPFHARQKFYLFLQENKNRIYICDQVHAEFYRHREVVIKQYQAKLVLESPSPYQKEVRQFIEEFLDKNEDVLEAYPKFRKDLKGVYENSLSILDKLKTWGEEKVDHCKQQVLKQDILELIPQLQILPRLQLEEYRHIRKEFNQLRSLAESFKSENKVDSIDAFLFKHPNKVFPGIGDIKKKPNSPYGDYYIYHEIMKWIANKPQEAPAIFLTNDVTKRDWVDSNKRAYVHYLENMYKNTNDIFYILHAAKIFTEVMGLSFDHLVTRDDILEDLDNAVAFDRQKLEVDSITPSSIQQMLQELYPNRTAVEEDDEFWQEVIDDLKEDYDLVSLYQLREDLLVNYHLLVQLELSRFGVYDQLDALEFTLEIIYD